LSLLQSRTFDASHIRQNVDHAETLRLLADLVRIPSPTADEGRIAEFVEKYAQAIGPDSVTKDDHHNLLITLRGEEPGPTVLFLTHTDSAGAGAMRDPFDAAVVDGAEYGKPGKVLRGLGACAPKSSVAAMLSATRTAKRLGLPRRGTVLVAPVTKDMQANHQGPRELLADLDVAIDLVVAGEPTGNRICLGARGISQFEIRLTGTPAHWGRPTEGANPLYALGGVIDAIQRARLASDPVLGQATIAAFDVRTDAAPPRTPSRVVLSVDRRTLPGEATADVVEAVRRLAEDAVRGRTGIGVEVERTRGMHSWRTEADSEAVRSVQAAARQVVNEELETTYITFASNAGYAISERGWNGLALGPGNIGDVGEREHVEVAQVERATLLYAAIMASL
jgi:succinyl-diaminopimelate desuccinylase